MPSHMTGGYSCNYVQHVYIKLKCLGTRVFFTLLLSAAVTLISPSSSWLFLHCHWEFWNSALWLCIWGPVFWLKTSWKMCFESSLATGTMISAKKIDSKSSGINFLIGVFWPSLKQETFPMTSLGEGILDQRKAWKYTYCAYTAK